MKFSRRAVKSSTRAVGHPGRASDDPTARRTETEGAALTTGTRHLKFQDGHPLPGVSVDRYQTNSPERPDERLLDDYRHGDRASFAHLVNRYHRELYHFLVRFLGNRASAEDVFQETFLQVHQSAEDFDTQRRFRPWLFTIAANKARDLIRAQSRRPANPLSASISPGDDESGEFIDLMHSVTELPSDPLEKRELQALVHNTISTMPENLREILLLSYFHQFPYKQISDILDIPLGTVKSRLHAAVAHFADRWRALNQRRNAS